MDRDLEVYVELTGRPTLVGRVWMRERNGRETATFRYDPSWLSTPRAYALGPSLMLGEGAYHADDGGTFGPFRDSSPDRWGQKLMRHRERDRASAAGTRARALLAGDYLIGVDDDTRVGALRFKAAGDDTFLSQSLSPVPPVIELRKLLGATSRLERGRARKGDLELVLAPGGSLGGARPKATVRGRDGRLYIAKFPWVQDAWSVIRWEAVALELASAAGIEVPKWELLPVQGNAVLLLERFDRRENNSRVGLISAMTAVQAKDHDERSYLEIVDALRQLGEAPADDVRQLWRRLVFNVLISNTDDHLRNHALLRGENGWRLSPAYDMNPCPRDLSNGLHVLALNEVEHTGSLEIAMSVAEYFGLRGSEARSIAAEVATAVKPWRSIAQARAVAAREIDPMASAFQEDEIERALSSKTTAAPKRARKTSSERSPEAPAPKARRTKKQAPAERP
jgi:serine/threonine-protein kinase HipA